MKNLNTIGEPGICFADFMSSTVKASGGDSSRSTWLRNDSMLWKSNRSMRPVGDGRSAVGPQDFSSTNPPTRNSIVNAIELLP